MKTSIKIVLTMLLTTIVFSCKKNENAPADNYSNSDSTAVTVDTISPNTDSVNVSTTGTTGATGEGSTGSGSAGTVQKGQSSVDLNTADSTAAKSKEKK